VGEEVHAEDYNAGQREEQEAELIIQRKAHRFETTPEYVSADPGRLFLLLLQ
jgi:hypothetical protein